MSLKLVSCSLLLTLSFGAFAQTKSYLLMGGAGEPKGQKTIFDIEVENAGNFFGSQGNWAAKTVFNGGHARTERILSGAFNADNTPFTEEAFEQTLRQYERKLENGELKAGDQLLIQMSNHGAIKGSDERTHKVSASRFQAADLTTLAGSSLVSMDRLERIAQLAQEKGVKLAILDFSCHSGSSLALANSNTCIISATGPNHFGWANTQSVFQARFTKALKAGKNLEEVFLEALKDKRDTSFPMISSDIGVNLQDQLYPMLTPYLYDSGDKQSEAKLNAFIEQQLDANACYQLDSHFEDAIQFSKAMEEIVQHRSLFFKRNANYQSFRDALSEYHELQSNRIAAHAALAAAEGPDLSVKESFCEEYAIPLPATGRERKYRKCDSWSPKELTMLDTTAYKKLLSEQLAKAKDEQSRKSAQASLRNLEKATQRKRELFRTRPELQAYARFYAENPELASRSRALANRVAKEYASLYTDVYREELKSDNSSNPCRDFKL